MVGAEQERTEFVGSGLTELRYLSGSPLRSFWKFGRTVQGFLGGHTDCRAKIKSQVPCDWKINPAIGMSPERFPLTMDYRDRDMKTENDRRREMGAGWYFSLKLG